MTRNNPDTQIVKIKIPAYISEPILNPDECTEPLMIQSLINNIDIYNNSSPDDKISRKIPGKNIVREIPHIDFDQYEDGSTPVLLLRIKEKKKGFTDLTVELENIGDSPSLTQQDALTTQYNCAVFYPVINHLGSEISTNWVIFVYVDPGKNDRDIISAVKLVLSKVLNLKIKNLKTNAANDLIRRQGLVSKLKVQYVVFTNIENERLEVRGEQISAKIKEVKNFEYDNVISEDVERFVNTTY